MRASIPRPPRCERGALPTELIALSGGTRYHRRPGQPRGPAARLPRLCRVRACLAATRRDTAGGRPADSPDAAAPRARSTLVSDTNGIGAVLDHVAVAAERASELWPCGRRGAGGRVAGWRGDGGLLLGPGRLLQRHELEGLEPRHVEENDFLRRFLDHTGPGPHHLTFKVPDIEDAIATTEAAGFPLVGVNLEDPALEGSVRSPQGGVRDRRAARRSPTASGTSSPVRSICRRRGRIDQPGSITSPTPSPIPVGRGSSSRAFWAATPLPTAATARTPGRTSAGRAAGWSAW